MVNLTSVLHRFHRHALGKFALPLSIVVGLLLTIAWNLAPGSPYSRILAPLTSATVVGGSFWFLEKQVRTRLWRIVYPEFDFSGTWQGGTEYNMRYAKDSQSEGESVCTFVPFTKHHRIRFKQDCLSVAVDYDKTEDFHGWNSTVATVVVGDNGQIGLRYAYEVCYRQDVNRDSRLPRESKGLEEVFVVNPQEGERPLHLTGWFSHTAEGASPRYSGAVEFRRESPIDSSGRLSMIGRFLVRKWLRSPIE